jgi:hypothetical protein
MKNCVVINNTVLEITDQFLDITVVSTEETILIGRILDVFRFGHGSDFFT